MTNNTGVDLGSKNQESSELSNSKSSKISKKLITQLVVIAVFILAGSFFVAQKYDLLEGQDTQVGFPEDANRVFRDMVYESLHTYSMTEQRLMHEKDGKLVLREFVTYDLADMKNVRTFTVSEIYEDDDQEPDRKMAVLNTPAGVSVRLEVFPGFEYNDNWFSIGDSGNSEHLRKIVDFPLDLSPEDFRQTHFGFFIPGIFEHNIRYKINSFINNKQIYEYFSDDFEQVEEDKGQKYYVYKITNDTRKMADLNRLVASELEQEYPRGVLEGANSIDGKIAFWVNKDTKRLERVNMTLKNGTTQTIHYYDYNKPTNIGDMAR